MLPYDLRVYSIRHPWIVVSLFVMLSLVFGWGNLRIIKGGILDNGVILREDDPFRRMDLYVKEKVHEGFEGREFIPFVINANIHSAEEAGKILRVTQAAQATFGETVLSLATVPAYQDTGETLLDEPYVTAAVSAPQSFQAVEWQNRVAADPSVFGLLIGKDFSWASVVRYLPPGYDEIHEFRRTVEFLEGREIPWWEWLWKKDIAPRDPWLSVSGWTMGRGLIDQGLNVDILTLVFLGVTLTLPICWAVFGSVRAALLSVGIMVIGGFFWTRGAMGLWGVQERVFSLLVYASVIVQGTSFALHKFAAREEHCEQERSLSWLQARSVDSLIATTAIISGFGFVTLWSFGLKPIRELGAAAAFGVFNLFVLAVFVLPAVDILTAPRDKSDLYHDVPRGWGRVFHDVSLGWLKVFSSTIDRIIRKCQNAAVWLTIGYRPWWLVVGTCGSFLCLGTLFARGEFASYTRALDFIRGTLVEREARFLNQPNNLGFEFLDLLVEPKQGEGVADPQFLRRAWAFQEAIKTIPGGRETSSILGTLQKIAVESFKKPFPETTEEVASAFFLLESRLAPAVQRQLYFPGGVRISISYGSDDSTELGRFRDAILAVAHQSFPDLKVNTFNKVPLYPQVDKYVREGKVWNVFTSQIGIVLLCGLILWKQNRRLREVRLAPFWGGIVMSVPLLFATVVLGFVMWAFRIPLDMATAPIGALTINAATDFSLYMTLTYQRMLHALAPLEALRKTLEIEGKVILADCILNMCCFLPLMSSHFLPVRQLGWMMGLMLVSCAVGTLLLMAALLPFCVTRSERGYAAESASALIYGRRLLPFLFRASGSHSVGSQSARAATTAPF